MTSKILSNKKCMPDSDSELELQNCDELPVTQDNQDGQQQHKDYEPDKLFHQHGVRRHHDDHVHQCELEEGEDRKEVERRGGCLP